MLIGLYQHHIPIDLVLFADTGAEQPHTYTHLDIMNQWLKEHKLPCITCVYKTSQNGCRLTLEQECLSSGSLPSIAYGHKKCSLKHKIAPQDKFCNHHADCRSVWRSGKRVIKFIGYDAGELKRRDKLLIRDLADTKYNKLYPLIEWGWNREDCIRVIAEAGLPQPGKSSCFFCPNMKETEIIHLRDYHPDLFQRALDIEGNAIANLRTLKGLGRNFSWKDRYGKELYTNSTRRETKRGLGENQDKNHFTAEKAENLGK